VAEQGNVADSLFLIARGSARYFFVTREGQQVYLFWLAPGDIFGGTSLLTEPSQYIVSTEMATEGTVLVWKRDVIRHLAAQYPRLLENGLSVACDYLVWYLATHLSLVCHSARERLAHVLVTLTSGIGRPTADGIDLAITNEQLANTANLTPFTVSRLLNAWQRDHVLSKFRGRIRLHDPEGLYRLSQGA
jgi:CRP/FNR family cyclic AMP-dependent transcriptional regulator